MGFGSLLRKGARAASALSKSPLGRVAGMVPGLGTVINAAGMAGGAYTAATSMGLLGGGGGKNLPALPPMGSGFSGGLPALPGTAGANPAAGDRSIFRNDPNIAKALEPFAISVRNLRAHYRAPKGYVIRRDSNGDPYGIPKILARKYLGWKPSKKPPISVGEYQALKKADRTVKKMRKVYSMIQRVDKNTTKGGKVKVAARKAK